MFTTDFNGNAAAAMAALAAAQEPRTPRANGETMKLKINLLDDDGKKGFHDVLSTRTPRGSGVTPGGLRRSRRLTDDDFQEDEEEGGDDDASVASAIVVGDGGSTSVAPVERLVEQEGEEDGGDDDASVASEGEDDDADADAKKSCWAALFCCKIFRK